MSCEEFEIRLQQTLDRRLDPAADEQLGEHARWCPSCRESLVVQQALFVGMRRTTGARPSAQFEDRVVARFVQEAAPRRRLSFGPILGLASVAAAAVLMLTLAATAVRRSATDGRPRAVRPAAGRLPSIALLRPAAPSSPKQAANDAPPRTEPSTESMNRPSQTAASPSTLESPLEFTAVSTSPPAWIDQLRGSIAEVTFEDFEQLEQVDQWTDGLWPVATSLQSVVNALWRTLPGLKEPRVKPAPGASSRFGSPVGWA